ncbi:MAG: hypothetical protein U9O96_05235 [Candidatus Thermoplasmatota archaeon]|nr:hypothetical protein [Candidatus Thermoplasmatota archaeon]
MDDIELTEGSKYVVRSIGSDKDTMVTRGTFTGYAYIGKEEGGMCIKMDASHKDMEGKIRIIPISMILSIDVIEKKSEKHGRGESVVDHYYG